MVMVLTRRPAEVASAKLPAPPDPEVPAQAKRRRFTAAYKDRILAEADACSARGQVGALLRREGLYFSHLTDWRRQREARSLAALAPQRRGRQRPHPLAQEVRRLQRENARLAQRLAQAEAVLEVQKKLSELLGIPLPSDGSDASS